MIAAMILLRGPTRSTRRLLCCVVTATLFALTAATTLARAADATDAADAKAARAKELWQEANGHYVVGEFAEAAEQYQSAYKLKADPAFLYNAAQSYRMAGKYEKAILLYKNYVIFYPNAKNISNVEQQIVKLQELVAAQKAQPQPPATTEPTRGAGEVPVAARPESKAPAGESAPATTAVPATTPAAPLTAAPTPTVSLDLAPAPSGSASGHGLRTAAIVTVSAGAAAIIVGAVFSAKASSASNDVTHAAEFNPDTDASGRSAASLQWVFYGLGAAAVGAGAVLYYLDHRQAHLRESKVALLPLAGSGPITGASLKLSF